MKTPFLLLVCFAAACSLHASQLVFRNDGPGGSESVTVTPTVYRSDGAGGFVQLTGFGTERIVVDYLTFAAREYPDYAFDDSGVARPVTVVFHAIKSNGDYFVANAVINLISGYSFICRITSDASSHVQISSTYGKFSQGLQVGGGGGNDIPMGTQAKYLLAGFFFMSGMLAVALGVRLFRLAGSTSLDL